MSEDKFTVKEIVLLINGKLDRFIDKYDADQHDQNDRIRSLELYKSRLSGNFRLTTWILSGSGLAGLVISLIVIFG